ncbi:MAG: response regulator [Alcanivorax sp.]
MTKCLIVDDVEVTRFTASQYLKDLGIEALIAETADAAFNTLKTNNVDVVLLDWHLGADTSGIELIKEIRQTSNNNVAIIIFSGVEKQESASIALEAGANSFLEKPTTKEKLKSCLQGLGIQTA